MQKYNKYILPNYNWVFVSLNYVHVKKSFDILLKHLFFCRRLVLIQLVILFLSWLCLVFFVFDVCLCVLPISISLVYVYLIVDFFYSDAGYNTLFTTIHLNWHFYISCRIVLFAHWFHFNVVQIWGLASYTTLCDPPFSAEEIHVACQEYHIY